MLCTGKKTYQLEIIHPFSNIYLTHFEGHFFKKKIIFPEAEQYVLYDLAKEKRIYIRVEFRQSLGLNFVSPFQPERKLKVYKSYKCSQIICSRIH